MVTREATMQFDEADDIPGIPAWSIDGRPLGRVSAVHVPLGSDQPLLIQLPAGAERQRLVPLVGAERRAEGLVLGYDAATIAGSPALGSVTALSFGETAYVLAHYGVQLADAGEVSITDRVKGLGDVGSVHPNVRRLPPLHAVPDPADRELPPIVVIRPGVVDEEPRP
jgi:hypothetical protein